MSAVPRFGFVPIPVVAAVGLLLGATVIAAGPGCAKVQTSGDGTGGRGTSGSGGTTVMPGIPNLSKLTVNPSSETLALGSNATGQVTPGMKSFTAEATFTDDTKGDVTNKVNWSLSPRNGSVSGGRVTISTPGTYTVTASSGSIMATATLTATFSGTKISTGFNSGNMGKLDGNPTGSVNIAYPLDGAVFPSNFGKVTFQIPKTSGQDIARLTFEGGGLMLQYYANCETTPNVGGGCYVTLESDVTKWFVGASAAADIKLTARLGSSSGGALAESSAIRLAWADVPLSGGLYYWTTIINEKAVPGYFFPNPADPRGTAVMRYNFNGDMPLRELVWTDRGSPRTSPPFQESPPSASGTDPSGLRPAWGEGRCIGCHAITPDGKLMAFSINGSDASSWAILNIKDTTLNELDTTAAPETATGLDRLKRFRKGNFATFTTFGPLSDLMVNMYRGRLTLRQVNTSLMVVKDDLFATATQEKKSDPFWSPDGLFFAFVTYNLNDETQPSKNNGDTKSGGQIWVASADAMGPHDDAKVVVPRKSGSTSYYPAISHDSRLMVFNRSDCSGPMNPGGYGTGPCDGYDDITATLWLTDPQGGNPSKLEAANGGEQNSNSWPRWSPDSGTFRGQRLYWVAFSSRRPYGMQVNSGAGTGAKPQLWFSAIMVGDEFNKDPSRPPVWLPDQNLAIEQPTGNHVPQWVKFVIPIE